MNFSIIDIIALVLVLYGAYRGFKYGGFTSVINLIGTLLVIILAYYLKNPLSSLMYQNLPFFSFGGIFKGISSINILVYEGISYILCIMILFVLLKILMKVTGIVDKFINMTVIMALPSKILGILFGALQFYIYVFVLLFVVAQIPATSKYITESKISNGILEKTPLLSNITNDIYKSVKEIYEICIKYDGDDDKTEGDKEALKTLLKYDIISPESVEKLKEKDKIKIENVDEIIEEYKKERDKENG